MSTSSFFDFHSNVSKIPIELAGYVIQNYHIAQSNHFTCRTDFTAKERCSEQIKHMCFVYFDGELNTHITYAHTHTHTQYFDCFSHSY